MKRTIGGTGFNVRAAPLASSQLIKAVAASLAVSALALSLVATLSVVSTKVAMALPMAPM